MTTRARIRGVLAGATMLAVVVGWSVPAASAPLPTQADDPEVQVEELKIQVEDPHPGGTTSGDVVDPVRDDVVLADRELADERVATEVIETDRFQTVGVTWPSGETGEDLAPQIRTMTDGTWSEWTPFALSDAAPDPGTSDATHAARQEVRSGTDSLFVGDVDAVQLSVTQGAAARVADVRLAVVGSPQPLAALAVPVPQQVSAPAVITRSQWGAAAATCAMDSAPLKGAVLHHTAGSNSYDSKAAAMQQIRNDQRYHMQSRGWCDLGYNFVVDKWGNIYEGRSGSMSSAVIGVHAGGFNTGTVGISMLGTYTSVAPSAATVRAVAQIIGWKFRAAGLDPTSSMSYWTGNGENSRYRNQTVTLPRVFGHRDVAYTACPGNQGQAILPSVRQTARELASPMFVTPDVSASSIPMGGSVTVRASTVSDIDWKLTVTDDRTGVVMRTSTGRAREASGGLTASWNGTGPSGAVGPGPYRLTVTGVGVSSNLVTNTWSTVVEVTGAQNPPTVAPVPVASDLSYVPITPTRLTDTRSSGQSLGPASRMDLKVTGVAGIPADAKAVALNVTGVHASATTFLRVWPAGQKMPGTSNLNLMPGWTTGAGVVSAVGGDGKVSIYNNLGSLHVVVDVTGYYVTGSGSKFGLASSGVRVYDSRTTSAGRLVAGKPRTVQVTGVGAVPANATAVVANISSVLPGGEGNITAYPASGSVPTTASVNHKPWDNVSNRTIVPLDSQGRLALSLQGASADVVVDVVGWYGPGQSMTFTPIVPQRAADTRDGSGALGPRKSRAFTLATSSVPNDAVAVLASVAATQQTATTFLTAWGSGSRPAASDLNTGPGRDQANSTVVRLNPTRGGNVYNDAGTTHVVIDTLGYFR